MANNQYYPLYKTKEVKLTEKEVKEVMKLDPFLLNKLKGASDSYRAIIRTHNKRAIEQRLEKAKADGASEEELKALENFYNKKYLGEK